MYTPAKRVSVVRFHPRAPIRRHMKQARAKGITALVFPDGVSLVTYKLDDSGNEVERILITLTPYDLEHMAVAYAGVSRQKHHSI